MATFPSITCSYGLSKSSSPVVHETRFGDGYSMRTTFGLNQDLKIYNPSWRNLSETDADTIETFLEARAGKESFTWTPPGESSSSKYVCASWKKSMPYVNRATITATFREVVEV